MPVYYFTNSSTTSTATTTATSGSTEYFVWWTDTGTTSTTTSSYNTAFNTGWCEPRYVQHRAYRDYQAEQDRQAEIVRSHAKKARERAQELLLSHLTAEQKQTFAKNKWFLVEGGKSGQRYRIRSADHLVANIDVMDGERVSHKLCAHADLQAVPLGDHLLAQKIMIEAAEDEFLRVANRHAA